MFYAFCLTLEIVTNFFETKVQSLVSLIIPLREIISTEKLDNSHGYDRNNAILISTFKSNFVFAHIDDRDFFIAKISELLSRLTEDRRSVTIFSLYSKIHFIVFFQIKF